jgi:hypothetical protein
MQGNVAKGGNWDINCFDGDQEAGGNRDSRSRQVRR